MPTVLQEIDEMDVSEKVRTMDYLWTSLETSACGYEPPEWHRAELERRERLYAAGRLPVCGWDEVKTRLAARKAAR